jgi:hypothetical protein
MPQMPFKPALAIAAVIALGGCASYGGYGSTGVSVGVGVGSGYGYDYYDPYYDDYYAPYYGWHDGYYYPGAGYYIYDRYGSRYRWNAYHRQYWESRRPRSGYRENWSGYDGNRRDGGRGWRDRRTDELPDYRAEQRRMLREQQAAPRRQQSQPSARQQQQSQPTARQQSQQRSATTSNPPDYRAEQRQMLRDQQAARQQEQD